MSAIEIILWPAVGFLLVAAFAALWQPRSAAPSPNERDSRQPDSTATSRPGLVRSLVLGGLALAILAFLLTRS